MKKLLLIPFIATISFLHAKEIINDQVKAEEVTVTSESVDNVIAPEVAVTSEPVDNVTTPEVALNPGPLTMYVEPVILNKNKCEALIASAGEKIEKVILKDKNKEPVKLQGAGTLDAEVTVIGKAAFHFPTGKTVEDLKGLSLLTRKVGYRTCLIKGIVFR